MGIKRKKKAKAGPTVEDLRAWVASPEGQARMADARERSRERTRAIRESRQVDPEILRTPMKW